MKKIFLLLALPALFSTGAFAQGFTKTVVSLTGNVINEVTRQPETVNLTVFDNGGNRVSGTRSIAAEKGYYFLTGLQPGSRYKVELKKKGFMSESWEFDVPQTNTYSELSHDFLIKPLEMNLMIPLAVPPFEFNKSKLRVGSELILDDVALALKNNPTVKYEIICFPDNNKDANDNMKKTTERAEAIREFLASKGIAADRITVAGNKATDPQNPPPVEKAAKGKRYIGKTYFKITAI